MSGKQNTADETFLAARISSERLAELESGRLTPHEAFKTGGDGYVLRARPDVGPGEPVPCSELLVEELPPPGEFLAPVRAGWR